MVVEELGLQDRGRGRRRSRRRQGQQAGDGEGGSEQGASIHGGPRIGQSMARRRASRHRARMSSRTFWIHGGRERPAFAIGGRQVEAQPPGGQPRRAQGADLGGVGPAHRAVDQVGQQLHQQVVARSPAVDVQLGQGGVQVGLHGHEHVVDLQGHGLQGGAGQMGGGGPQVHAADQAPGLVVPVRRAQPGQGGHDADAAAVGDRGGQGGEGRLVLQPQQLGHEGDGVTRDRDVALQSVQGARGLAPGDRAGQAVSRPDAGVGDGHQGRAGAAGGLDPAGAVDPVAVEGGVGVAHDRVDRHAGRQGRGPGGGLAEQAVGRQNLGQDGRRHVEQSRHLQIPGQGLQVHQLGARGVAVVGGVAPTSSQLPKQPRVDRAGLDLAALGPLAQGGSWSSSQASLPAENMGLRVRPVRATTSGS